MEHSCEICGTKLIFDPPDLKCPECDNMCLLSKKDALQIWSKQNTWFSEKFNEIISESNKKELISWLLEEREILASDFITNTPSLKLGNFLATSLLIKAVFEKYDTVGTVSPNADSVEKLIDYFGFFVGVQAREDLLKDEFAYYVAKEPFDIKTIDESKLMSNFKFIYNQQWRGIVQTFEDNLILTEDSAKSYVDTHRKEYDDIIANPSPKKHSSMEQTIQDLYPTFKSFKVGLTKNAIFARFFDLTYLEEKQISPETLNKIINEFVPKKPNSIALTNVPSKLFLKFIRRKLKELDKHEAYNALVFSKGNKDIFPFCVELDGFVWVSTNFLVLMNTFYIPFFHKKLYNKETLKHSTIFENRDVPDKLRINGFKVKQNVKDRKKNPSLQIDSIAWKNEVLYVIETKIWDIGCVFESKKTHHNRSRDLCGIVDGIKYTSGKPTQIPSLIKKIDFVNTNIESLCPDYEIINEIKGLIITKSYPPIDSYKGVIIMGFNDIGYLDANV